MECVFILEVLLLSATFTLAAGLKCHSCVEVTTNDTTTNAGIREQLGESQCHTVAGSQPFTCSQSNFSDTLACGTVSFETTASGISGHTVSVRYTMRACRRHNIHEGCKPTVRNEGQLRFLRVFEFYDFSDTFSGSTCFCEEDGCNGESFGHNASKKMLVSHFLLVLIQMYLQSFT